MVTVFGLVKLEKAFNSHTGVYRKNKNTACGFGHTQKALWYIHYTWGN